MKKEKKKIKKDIVEYFKKSSTKNSIEIPFDELVNDELPREINIFNLVKKRAYCNRIEFLTDYNNNLLNDYDNVEDFIMTYLELKWKVDKKFYVPEKDDEGKIIKREEDIFINDMYNTLFVPQFTDFIEQWIEDHYTLNIDEKNIDKSKKFNPVLQFSDRHCKMLNCISMGMKLIIPIITHFAGIYNIVNVNNFLEKSYDYLFEIFSHETDLYTKLWESVYSRVVVTKNSDKTFWSYVEIEGNGINKVTSGIYQKLITDIITKYKIEENLINLNHVVINNNIGYTFTGNIKINYKPLNLAESEEDVSDYDKISINTARIDEGIIIINEVNIEMTIKKLIKQYKLKITKKELEYYCDTLKKNKFQENMLCNFFGKDLGNTDCIFFCEKQQYITLLIIMKHILINNGFTLLPSIIVGGLENINEKSTLGKKVLVDIIKDPEFEELRSSKYSFTENNYTENPDKQSMIIKLEANILNNKFLYNDYENPDTYGQDIEIENKNLLKKEILDFANMI